MTETSNSLEFSENQLWFAERQHSGFLVALWLDPADAEKLVVPGGEPYSELHVTLAYCGDYTGIDETNPSSNYRRRIRYREIYTSVLDGTIAGFGRFVASESSDGKDVFYATPDVPRLFDVRQQIVECLRCNGLSVSSAHGYTPHITLAYIDTDAETPKYEVPELSLKFAGVTVMSGTRRIDIPFWQDEQEATISMSESGELPLSAPLGSQPARALYFGSFDREWIPFLPKPGVYSHEAFGSLDLTSETYDEMLRNFDSYVYKQDLPIRATHMPDTSGAIGWIKPGGMRLAEDGSLEVKPEWNELGRGLVDGDRFRYASAEFCQTWRNPVTEEVVNNVAIGLALVTRPHFKTDVLNPLSASEALAFGEFVDKEVAESTETPPESEKGTQLDPVTITNNSTNANPLAVATSATIPPTETTPVVATPVVATPPVLEDVTLSDLTQVVLSAEQRQQERRMFSDLTTRVELAERRACNC
jgi:2'-5' RNA ligase